MGKFVAVILLGFCAVMGFMFWQVSTIEPERVVVPPDMSNKASAMEKQSINLPLDNVDWQTVHHQEYTDQQNWSQIRSFVDPKTGKTFAIEQKMENGILYQKYDGEWIQQIQVEPHDYVLGTGK